MTADSRVRRPLPDSPAELIEHLNRGDCVLFVGDALDAAGSQSARLLRRWWTSAVLMQRVRFPPASLTAGVPSRTAALFPCPMPPNCTRVALTDRPCWISCGGM